MNSVDARPVLPAQPRPLLLPLAAGRDTAREALELTLTGVVQGVGFRPYVHRLAMVHRLAGWVRNEAGAVRLRVEGDPSDLSAFAVGLRTGLPPLARIDSLESVPVEPQGLRSFQVVESDTTRAGRLPVSPDVATCAACEAELRDLHDPRYRYPFITCTDCGPRFTVIEEMPYDRVRTTMAAFRQCPSCASEYESPTDRRYHSETNSCPVCGPTLWLRVPEAEGTAAGDPGAERSPLVRGPDDPVDDEAVWAAAAVLERGGVLALRGLGGFHLAVRADDEAAVIRLRSRKLREAKPLALMARDLEQTRRLVRLNEDAEAVLTSPERPIVVLPLRDGAALAPSVAPGLDSVGVMLPYTPLHHLLLEAMEDVPLVMTSGNVSDEPIATGNEEALTRLGRLADAFLLHDREIVARYDDSVLRMAEGGPIVIRRSRGYAPMPLALPVPTGEGLLAVGPHLKNTFTLAQGRDAYVSQHIGDLESLETQRHFEDALARFKTLFHVEPRRVVADLHPGYLSTTLAERSGLEMLPPVQHHHAHVAAVMAEHGRTGPVLGLSFDGTGYGGDGTVWGCEFLVADLVDFRRLAHLRYAPLPGGDRAARSPWRALSGYASLSGRLAGSDHPSLSDHPPLPDRRSLTDQLQGVAEDDLRLVAQQIRQGVNAPMASSLGRLFDAVAALLGIRLESDYEGQAAMELEAMAGDLQGRVLPFPLRADPGPAGPARDAAGSSGGGRLRILDPVPLLRALAEGREAGRSVPLLAADFHETVIHAVSTLAVQLAGEEGLDTVALSGGCFQNVRLWEGVTAKISGAGLEVLRPRVLGPNDGAVSYGQAVVAAARLESEKG